MKGSLLSSSPNTHSLQYKGNTQQYLYRFDFRVPRPASANDQLYLSALFFASPDFSYGLWVATYSSCYFRYLSLISSLYDMAL